MKGQFPFTANLCAFCFFFNTLIPKYHSFLNVDVLWLLSSDSKYKTCSDQMGVVNTLALFLVVFRLNNSGPELNSAAVSAPDACVGFSACDGVIKYLLMLLGLQVPLLSFRRSANKIIPRNTLPLLVRLLFYSRSCYGNGLRLQNPDSQRLFLGPVQYVGVCRCFRWFLCICGASVGPVWDQLDRLGVGS